MKKNIVCEHVTKAQREQIQNELGKKFNDIIYSHPANPWDWLDFFEWPNLFINEDGFLTGVKCAVLWADDYYMPELTKVSFETFLTELKS